MKSLELELSRSKKQIIAMMGLDPSIVAASGSSDALSSSLLDKPVGECEVTSERGGFGEDG